MSKKVEQTVETIVKEPIAALGYELTDVEFVKEDGEWVLTVFIYSEHGISLDDCERVSVAIDPILEELDPIEQSYFLSVSSVGLDRPLKKPRDFERNIDKEITLHLYAPIDKKKEYTGVLKAFDEQAITIEIAGAEIAFARSQVSVVKQYIKF